MPKSTKDAEKLNIAFIVPFLFKIQRGIERSCVSLANELAKRNHQITLLTWGEVEQKTDFFIHPDIHILTVPYFRYYRKYLAIPFYIYYLLRNSYDVVNVYFAGYGESEALTLVRKLREFQINFIAGYPVEQSPHRYQEFRHYNLDQLLDNVIVKSPSMVSGVSSLFTCALHVIPNGIDMKYFRPGTTDPLQFRQSLGIRSGDLVLLTVAALEERKGIQYVLDLLSRLIKRFPNLHYVIVGEGPYRNVLEALSTHPGLSRHVQFIGAVTDVIPYYELADIFVLLSYGEGFPNVVLEAWAMGLPVIMSSHTPYPSIATEADVIIDTNNVTKACNHIEELLSSTDLQWRTKLVRQHAYQNYEWSRIAEQYERIFLNEQPNL